MMLKHLVRFMAPAAFFGAIGLLGFFLVDAIRGVGLSFKYVAVSGLCLDIYGVLLLFGAENPEYFWRSKELKDVETALRDDGAKAKADAAGASKDGPAMAFLNQALIRQSVIWITLGFALQIVGTLFA